MCFQRRLAFRVCVSISAARGELGVDASRSLNFRKNINILILERRLCA